MGLACFGQNITILESADTPKKVEKPVKTTIVFTTSENKPAYIYQYNWGQFSTGSVGSLQELSVSHFLTAPAKFTISEPVNNLIPGVKSGASTFCSDFFKLSPTGGTQYWDIRPPRGGMVFAGYMCTILGLCTFFPGCLMASWGDDAGITVALIGGAVTAVGIPMWTRGVGKVTLVRIDY